MSSSDNSGSFYKRLRPLIPKPSPPKLEAAQRHGSPATHLRGETMERHNIHQDFNEVQNSHLLRTDVLNSSRNVGNCRASSQQPVTSRWNPTAEQLRILEDLYKRGLRTPSAEQIQYITAQLRCYGKIEGKNVFYWFQNHKAREKQKRRRRMEMLMCAESLDITTNIQTQTNVMACSEPQKATRMSSSITDNFQEPHENFLKLAIPYTDQQEYYCKVMQIDNNCMPFEPNYGRKDLCDQQENYAYSTQNASSSMNIDEYGGVAHEIKTLELFPLNSSNSNDKDHEVKSMTNTSSSSFKTNSVEYCEALNYDFENMEYKYKGEENEYRVQLDMEEEEEEEEGEEEEEVVAPCNSYFQFLPLQYK